MGHPAFFVRSAPDSLASYFDRANWATHDFCINEQQARLLPRLKNVIGVSPAT
jgi:hypothetical protein